MSQILLSSGNKEKDIINLCKKKSNIEEQGKQRQPRRQQQRHCRRVPLNIFFIFRFLLIAFLSISLTSHGLQFPFRRNNKGGNTNPKITQDINTNDDNGIGTCDTNTNSNSEKTSSSNDTKNTKKMPTSFAKNRLVYGKDDALFGCIEKAQGDTPFGRVLDAGTGMHSLRWMATLHGDGNDDASNTENDGTGGKGMTEFVAITADKTMQKKVQMEADALQMSHLGKVVIGNWFGNSPLNFPEESFDTILADYLIGAMDGFSPYQQEDMIPKLAKLLRPGGKLYIVGLQPIPDQAKGDANVICKVRQVRDACILLAGHRCYREFPVEWIHAQINNNVKTLKLKTTTHFPILYRHETIVTQINVGRSKFPLFPSPELAASMKKVLDDLEQQSLQATKRAPGGRIRLGFDYVVVAKKKTHEELFKEEEEQLRQRQEALGYDLSAEETGESTVSGSSSTLGSAPTFMSAASSTVIDGASTYTATTIDGASTYDATSTIDYTSTMGSRYDYGDEDDHGDVDTILTMLYAVQEENENEEEEEGEQAEADDDDEVDEEEDDISFDGGVVDEQTTIEDGIEVVVVENKISASASGDESTIFGNVEESFENDDGDDVHGGVKPKKQRDGQDDSIFDKGSALFTNSTVAASASSDGDSTAVVENSTIMSAGLNTIHTNTNHKKMAGPNASSERRLGGGGQQQTQTNQAVPQSGEDNSTVLSAGLNTLLTPNDDSNMNHNNNDQESFSADSSTILGSGLNTLKTNPTNSSTKSDNSANNNTVVSAVLEANSTLTGLNSL